jgi:hypothetical protein
LNSFILVAGWIFRLLVGNDMVGVCGLCV